MAKRRPLKNVFRRLFHSRKIIVVSDHGVEYYPLSRWTQASLVVAVLGFIVWASYSTGSFMAAQSQINEKDRTIAKANLENRKISGEFSLLKNDLVKIKNEDGDLSDYSKFVIKQYSSNDTAILPGLDRKEDSTNHAMVAERIEFLEKQVSELKQDKTHFVDEVHSITGGKIGELEKAISITGLNNQVLQKNLTARIERRVPAAHGGGRQASAEKISAVAPQGGPYIPYSTSEMADPNQREALNDVEHLAQLYAILELMPLGKPMPNAEITSGFGVRSDPFNRSLARHMGLDFSDHSDSRVHATADGQVLSSGMQAAYGNMVEIDHGLGITTRYAHLSKLMVQEGQHVKKGDVIGLEGSTGRSTGLHLHYEVRFDGQALDPENFLKAGLRVSQK